MASPARTAVSHTIATSLLNRLERLAYRHRVSRSSIIEYAIVLLFDSYPADAALGEVLRARGARRRSAG